LILATFAALTGEVDAIERAGGAGTAGAPGLGAA